MILLNVLLLYIIVILTIAAAAVGAAALKVALYQVNELPKAEGCHS